MRSSLLPHILVLIAACLSLGSTATGRDDPSAATQSTRPSAAALTMAQDVVDFEPDPGTGMFPDGSAPRDEMPIGDQFADSHGIHFGIVVEGDEAADDEQPLLEQAGENPPDAFRYGEGGPLDQAAPGYEDQLGDWLLKADLKDGSRMLLITYDNPVGAAAGQIWDIDGTPTLGYEQWRVEALDRDGNVLDSIDSPAGHGLALDGLPWPFVVRADTPDRIKAVRVRFIGRKSIVGLAFDRFTPSQPDAPPSPSATHVPEASATPATTATPAPPPTAVPSPTSTSVASPTTHYPTDVTHLAHLPITLRERDIKRKTFADVVLVLDTSSSMSGAKLAAAKDAISRFAQALTLPSDRLAIVSFDAEARVELELTRRGEKVLRALERIETREGTRIDRGLEVALGVIADARRNGSPNQPFVLLLSDGRQSAGIGASLLTAARIRAAGVSLHAIGFGDEHDTAHLQALAGAPERYHAVGESAGLSETLTSLHEILPCVPEEYWGRRCP